MELEDRHPLPEGLASTPSSEERDHRVKYFRELLRCRPSS